MNWTEVALASAASFLLTVLFTWLLIPFLKSRQLGKAIREDGPAHQAKAGTPTMGGIAMLAAIGILTLVVAGEWWQKWTILDEAQIFNSYGFYFDDTLLILCIVVLTGGFAVLGLIDDFKGLARKGRSREIGVGFSARHTLALQTLISVVAISVLLLFGVHRSWAHAPPTGGPLVWILVMTLVVVGTANGVNLSDGLDGLAAGLLALAFLGLGLVMAAFLYATGNLSPVLFTGLDLVDAGPVAAREALVLKLSFIAAASCVGFLVFNRNPARVFMGNVASMGLGALLAALAILGGVWYLLPIIGAVFVVEVVSDLIQVGYYKYSGGKRVFRMAPIHHHFEKGGWPETKVVKVFWSFGLLAALSGVGLAAWLGRS